MSPQTSQMEIVFTVLILLLAVAVSGVGVRVLPFKLPLPLVQIALGALLAWPRLGLHVTFDPEIFMMLFIPPLLFADGWRIPKREFFMARRSILLLALGLVFMTVLAVGYFVHALVPSISLPVAFALAAVLSPTDAVALTGIAGKNRIPAQPDAHPRRRGADERRVGPRRAEVRDCRRVDRRVLAARRVDQLRDHRLGRAGDGCRGELAVRLRGRHLLNVTEEGDPAPGVVMTLLIPFAAYLFAEHFGWSGILAAVAAGMMMNYTSIANAGPVSARVRANSTWTMIEFVFNGMVFILLGLQFPHILGRALIDAHETSNEQVGRLIGYIAAVVIALYALRFVWVWLLRWFASRGAAKQGMANAVPGCARSR